MQNQHSRWVLTLVDSFPKSSFGFEPHGHDGHFHSTLFRFCSEYRSHSELQDPLASWDASGLHLVSFQYSGFLSNAYATCPHQDLKQRNVAISLGHCRGIHAAMIHPSYSSALSLHAGSNDLNIDSGASVIGST